MRIKEIKLLNTEFEELKKNIEIHSNGGLDLIHKEMALDPLAYQNTESLIYEIQKRFIA